MPLSYKLEDRDDVSYLSLTGNLDITSAPNLGETINGLVEARTASVVVNLHELELIDSSGVACLVGLYKRLRAVGGQMVVTGARDQPLAIFKLLRMDKVFLV